MQTPDETTVSGFEIEEHGLSVVLTNAIEDAREVVDHLTKKHDDYVRAHLDCQGEGLDKMAATMEPAINRAAELQYRAMRVLGLLEATRDREGGNKA